MKSIKIRNRKQDQRIERDDLICKSVLKGMSLVKFSKTAQAERDGKHTKHKQKAKC